MDVAVGTTALVCVFAGVLVARIAQLRQREDDAHGGPAPLVGLLIMAVGLFFAMNVSLWLILPALAVAEVARRLSQMR
jgi:hypothetical protein